MTGVGIGSTGTVSKPHPSVSFSMPTKRRVPSLKHRHTHVHMFAAHVPLSFAWSNVSVLVYCWLLKVPLPVGFTGD